MSGRRRRATNDETGAIAMIVAISTVMLFVLAALVVELGLARDTKRQSQNAADAAVLAAGNALYSDYTSYPDFPPTFTAAVDAAKAYAATNYGVTEAEWGACTDNEPLAYQFDPSISCITFENTSDSTLSQTSPNRVRVRIPTRSVDTPIGSLAGGSSVPVGTAAEIGVRLETVAECALCVIGPGPHDVQNGDATVSGGNIHFNGDVSVGSNGLVATDGDITVEGSASNPFDSDNWDPLPDTGATPMPDPLAFMAMPDLTGLTVKTDPCTQGPGRYGSANLRNMVCNLAPGLYVIAGSGAVWDMAGNSSTVLSGTGVTLFFTCGTPGAPAPCSNSSGATLDASGNGQLSIQAPTSGPLQGLAIVYDRGNTSTLRLTGNGAAGFTGTLYAPGASLEMNGNGCSSTLNALIVVDTLEMNGNPACLRSAYAPGGNVAMPPDQLHLTR